MNTGIVIYVLLILILALMWRRVRGMSVEQLLERDAHEHHCVHRVFAKHPHGGNWSEFQRWYHQAQ